MVVRRGSPLRLDQLAPAPEKAGQMKSKSADVTGRSREQSAVDSALVGF
jgi:hypothetical protein